MPREFEEIDKTNQFTINKHLSTNNISSISNLDKLALATDDSDNSSSFSLNKSSYSNNDSSCDESTSNSRLAENNSDNTHTEANDKRTAATNAATNRKSSVSPVSRRHPNSFQRTIRRFHSAFIEKRFLGNNKNSEEENVNNKNNKVSCLVFFFANRF